jgi:predicted RNA binding protein YcfA (HicA-like mRNA interferase family)
MKLPIVSSADVERVLKKAGFRYAPKRGKGSHKAFYKEKEGRKRLVVVPERKSIPRGTLISVLEQAGLSREEFIELLRG